MADEDKDSKTEDPTQKKLDDAAKDGNVPFSRETATFASTLAIYVFVIFFAAQGIGTVGAMLRDTFAQADQWSVETGPDVLSLIIHLAMGTSPIVVPAFALLIVFGVSASIFQNLPQPVLKRIAPDPSKVSPMKGFGRLFSKTTLVEFGKSFIKLIAVSGAMYLTLQDEFVGSLDLMFSDPARIFSEMGSILNDILLVVLAASAIVAIADFFWQRHTWWENLRMTKQQIKDEMKQSQGDPQVKSRQRSFAQSLARKRMMNDVPRATLVVTNPTHYAVALRYNRSEDDAPVVVAKGQNLVALKIREIAEKNGVPIFEDPPLARSMFAQVSVDSVIPSVFYKAVAELIHRVYSKQKPN